MTFVLLSQDAAWAELLRQAANRRSLGGLWLTGAGTNTGDG